MNDAIGTKGFEVFGYKENLIRTIEIDSNKLNKQQLAFYNLIKEMTDKNNSQPHMYRFVLREIDYEESGSIMAIDAFEEQRINLKNLENLAKAGKGEKINILEGLLHIFSEQKFGQDYMIKKHIDNTPMSFYNLANLPEQKEFRKNTLYPLAHEYALNEMLHIFGYRYYTAYEKSLSATEYIYDLDLLDADNRFIATIRVIDKNGSSKIYEGTSIITIGNEGHYMQKGEKIENPEWRAFHASDKDETVGAYIQRINNYFNYKPSFKEF